MGDLGRYFLWLEGLFTIFLMRGCVTDNASRYI